MESKIMIGGHVGLLHTASFAILYYVLEYSNQRVIKPSSVSFNIKVHLFGGRVCAHLTHMLDYDGQMATRCLLPTQVTNQTF